jgi:hypothetical protein
MNLRLASAASVCVSLDETVTEADVNALLAAFAAGAKSAKAVPTTAALLQGGAGAGALSVPAASKRASAFLTHPVFNSYHSETEMLRYLHKLVSKDLSLATAMIPLGSCTMKLNATTEMIPVTWPTVGGIHPFAPKVWRGSWNQSRNQSGNLVFFTKMCSLHFSISHDHAWSLFHCIPWISIHPSRFVCVCRLPRAALRAAQDQSVGYKKMMDGLIEDLCEITGFAGLSLQPNAGAQGEVQHWAPLTPPPRVLGDLTS